MIIIKLQTRGAWKTSHKDERALRNGRK